MELYLTGPWSNAYKTTSMRMTLDHALLIIGMGLPSQIIDITWEVILDDPTWVWDIDPVMIILSCHRIIESLDLGVFVDSYMTTPIVWHAHLRCPWMATKEVWLAMWRVIWGIQLTVKGFVPHEQWERYLFRPLDETDWEEVCGRTSDKSSYHFSGHLEIKETSLNIIRMTALCLMFKLDI